MNRAEPSSFEVCLTPEMELWGGPSSHAHCAHPLHCSWLHPADGARTCASLSASICSSPPVDAPTAPAASTADSCSNSARVLAACSRCSAMVAASCACTVRDPVRETQWGTVRELARKTQWETQ
jgi:hypothetical protein